MGPATTEIDERKPTLPVLKDDSSNWIHYSERIITHAKSKGLGRHLAGTARKPAELTQRVTGEWFIAGTNTPLDDEKLEKHEEKQDEYETKESKLRDIIYQTISTTRFAQVKNESTASKVWDKLVQLNENQGDMVQMNILTRLQQMRCDDEGDLQKHLMEMSELKDMLIKGGNPLSDLQFGAYIRASIPQHYR
ncbi:hypothetical protein B0H15DRAFT_781096, partial [Mycena belliarum]